MSQYLTIQAVYENGVFRPCSPLAIDSPQKVTLIVQTHGTAARRAWPDDTARIYNEIAEEDRHLAESMQRDVKQTWPAHEE